MMMTSAPTGRNLRSLHCPVILNIHTPMHPSFCREARKWRGWRGWMEKTGSGKDGGLFSGLISSLGRHTLCQCFDAMKCSVVAFQCLYFFPPWPSLSGFLFDLAWETPSSPSLWRPLPLRLTPVACFTANPLCRAAVPHTPSEGEFIREQGLCRCN